MIEHVSDVVDCEDADVYEFEDEYAEDHMEEDEEAEEDEDVELYA